MCLVIDCDSGLKFYGGVVGEDGNLLNELFDYSIIKLCDVSLLSGDEVQFFSGCFHFRIRHDCFNRNAYQLSISSWKKVKNCINNDQLIKRQAAT